MTTIFVFGSNLAGRHGAGGALHAFRHYGAKRGVAIGRTGDSYAIPTKDKDLKTLPITLIRPSVRGFLAYALEHPDLEFKVTAIGCGLAGYKPEDIAPMFKGAPPNCILPEEFKRVLDNEP
jgi:hypothetical protein